MRNYVDYYFTFQFFKMWSQFYNLLPKVIPSMQMDIQKGISEFLKNNFWFPIEEVWELIHCPWGEVETDFILPILENF